MSSCHFAAYLQLHLVLLLQDGAVVVFLCGGRVREVEPLHSAQQSAVSSYGTSSSPYLDADTFVAPAPEAQTGDRLALKQVSPSHLSNCQKSISTSKFDSFSPKFSLHFHHQNTLNLIHSFGV